MESLVLYHLPHSAQSPVECDGAPELDHSGGKQPLCPGLIVSISSIDFSPLLFRKYKDYHSHSIHINLVILCLCKYNIHIEYNTVRFYKIYVLINVRDIFTGDGDLI